MAGNFVLAAVEEAADIYTLGNNIFTQVLTFAFMGAVIVGAVVLGAVLRKKHDAKNGVSEASATTADAVKLDK